MHIKLREFLTLVAYGTNLVVIDTESDTEIYKSESFITPYSVDRRYKKLFDDAEVYCVGVVDGIMYVWTSSKERGVKYEQVSHSDYCGRWVRRSY